MNISGKPDGHESRVRTFYYRCHNTIPAVSWKQRSGLSHCPSKARGSKYPIFEDSGPKSHLGYGLWGQRPQILGTWTRWESPQRGHSLDTEPGPIVPVLVKVLSAAMHSRDPSKLPKPQGPCTPMGYTLALK